MKSITRVAVVTVVILLSFFTAMQFDTSVNWSLGDFAVAGLLISSCGMAFELIARKGPSLIYRLAVGVAVAAAFLLTWVNLAVGFIGSGANPANLLYGIVLAVWIIGAVVSQFEARGMARAMFATAAAMLSVPLIVLIAWNGLITNEEVGFAGILLLNGFFVALFAISGFLFLGSTPKAGGAQPVQ
jgi:hypothetical protein